MKPEEIIVDGIKHRYYGFTQSPEYATAIADDEVKLDTGIIHPVHIVYGGTLGRWPVWYFYTRVL